MPRDHDAYVLASPEDYFFRDDEPEEDDVPEECPACGGDGFCPFCDGSGACHECEGTGDCPECEGNGVIR